jgi:hypothetical protein
MPGACRVARAAGWAIAGPNGSRVSSAPEGIDLARHRDATPASRFRWLRRGFLTVLGLFAALALIGVFGQPSRTSTAVGPKATLRVEAPTRARGGLFFEGRFTVDATTTLEHATLVLDEGWASQLSINTIEPAPASEESRDGLLALDFGRLEAGDRLVAYLQFQVNPASMGRRPQGVRLLDGEELLASVDRTFVVFP